MYGDEDVIDVAEDQCFLLGIAILLLDECLGVVAPVATGVQVVGSVVSIIEGEAVALIFVNKLSPRSSVGCTHGNVDEGDTRQVVRVRVAGVDKSMLSPVSNHQTTSHD